MATNKPQRPPPPRGGSVGVSGGGIMGISFRSIEEEDEEELISFTGKFDHVVEEKHRNQQKEKAEKERAEKERAERERVEKERAEKERVEKERMETEKAVESEKAVSGQEAGKQAAKAPLERAASFPSSLETRTRRESLEEDKSSPTRKIGKQLSDYKEKISGLKERITDTISRKLEEFNTESPAQSPSPSPDRETPRPGEHRFSGGGAPTPSKDAPSVKAPTTSGSKPAAGGPSGMPANGEDHEFVEPLEDSTTDEFMDVIEEHFGAEPMEDFTGIPNASSGMLPPQPRKRSSLQRIIKAKTQAGEPATPVSMSTLLHSHSAESLDHNNQAEQPSQAPRTACSLSSLNSVTSVGGGESQSELNSSSPRVRHRSHLLTPHQLTVAVGVVLVWLLMPLPPYLAGMLAGALLALGGFLLYTWVMVPPPVRQPLVIPPLSSLPPLQSLELRERSSQSGEFKGWMNELMDYQPENYHISQTHSVYVTLNGSLLRLQRPRMSVPRRATYKEEITTSSYIHQRHLDLQKAHVWLAPAGLVPKRYWSKKYPICVHVCSHFPVETSMDPSFIEEEDFEVVSKEKCSPDTFFLFARTGREKEEWFRRLLAATLGRTVPSHAAELAQCLQCPVGGHKRSSSDPAIQLHPSSSYEDSPSPTPSPSVQRVTPGSLDSIESMTSDSVLSGCPPPELLEFVHFMSRLMPAAQSPNLSRPSCPPQPSRADVSGAGQDGVFGGEVPGWLSEQQLVWLNALAGRCLWDFLHSPQWASRITEKLQRKLSKIHVPYFMEELSVTDIHLGSDIPVVRRAGHPFMDDRGLWLELDLLYVGGFKMTIETKVNLMRLKKDTTSPHIPRCTLPHMHSPITDPDEEDSAESSTDEEDEVGPLTEEGTTGSGTGAGGTSRKLLRYLDRITQSKYFQQATENKYVRRAMEGVSNTPLILTVELRHLAGTLAINIPPPPSDRLWYGFNGNPKLSLVAKPKVGERAVTITHVTEWIEKKLLMEFQRVIVLPNMDDLIVPTLMSGLPDDVVPPLETMTHGMASGSRTSASAARMSSMKSTHSKISVSTTKTTASVSKSTASGTKPALSVSKTTISGAKHATPATKVTHTASTVGGSAAVPASSEKHSTLTVPKIQ